MNRIIFLWLFYSISSMTNAQENIPVYLIPGQGGDGRLFNNLTLPKGFEARHVVYERPEAGMSMQDYAKQLTRQIDTTNKFILLGVSLGGMLATEMSELVDAEKVIIISSAKGRHELPGRYTFQSKVPIYKLVSPKTAKFGAKLLQPIVEPDRQKEKETFKAMLRDKDAIFLRRTIEMIMHWDRTDAPKNIIHIHGNKDHTIPIRKVDYDILVPGGSHMITLTRGEEISQLVKEVLLDKSPSS
ncbi:MAG: alpha/beta hydrolase [Cytophagales bacterium]|nr:alpha/beta hydrolase [Cytophagales bacterium]